MNKNQNREKMNPTFASKKGKHPTWGSYEESKHNWKKTFKIKGVKSGKKVKQKRRKFNRETIRKELGDEAFLE